MNRREKILTHISKSEKGVEVGPSHSPIAKKKDGYDVHVIDHLDREGLIAKYTGHDVQLENIEEVDFIWKGEPYAALTGRKKYYDWVIASHVIEHTPDLVGFLNECDSILRDTGVVSLAIPDKRYCFDHFRPVSGLSKIIDAHVQKHTNHTPGTAAEFFLNITKRDGHIAWNNTCRGDYSFFYTPENAASAMQRLIGSDKYEDFHSWCFTPHSFRLIIHDLHELGLIALKEVSSYPTDGCEFFVTLGRQGQGWKSSRLELLKAIDEELSEECVSDRLASAAAIHSQEMKSLRKQIESLKADISRLHGSRSRTWAAPLRRLCRLIK